MDPSNNNSFGNPTQTPGAIVSGGDTAVDNTAAGGSGGGFASANFPSGGISVGDKTGSRKGLIIGIIIAFVLLIGGGLIALATTSGMFGKTGDLGSGTTMETAFNRYANYLIYGESKESPVDEEMLSGNIELTNKLVDDTYLEMLATLYEAFYDKAGDSQTDFMQVGIDLEKTKDEIFFLKDYADMQLDTNSLLSKYNEGRDAVDSYIASLIETSENENELKHLLNEYNVALAKVLIEYWDIYKEYGCINGGSIDYDCAGAIDYNTISDVSVRLGSANAQIEQLQYNTAEGIREQSIDISSFLEGNK